ncbi:hypothetical protein PGTUg99_016067 [Puccinia graminis f. sp. tritici]|uniref:Uncharacterized protein n=1 Tax=Puccinia graminis f. sp. tritici TaxID=56615 RepID=A0A5B0RWP1_PUCGR|nr:hypothetical protein PGTUg99_016067 [Puccinia graminis f. sp. tritici]
MGNCLRMSLKGNPDSSGSDMKGMRVPLSDQGFGGHLQLNRSLSKNSPVQKVFRMQEGPGYIWEYLRDEMIQVLLLGSTMNDH